MNRAQADQLAWRIAARFTALAVEVRPTTEGYVVVLSYSDEGNLVCIVFPSEQDFEAVNAYAYAGSSPVPFLSHYEEKDISTYRRLIFYQIGDYELARRNVSDGSNEARR